MGRGQFLIKDGAACRSNLSKQGQARSASIWCVMWGLCCGERQNSCLIYPGLTQALSCEGHYRGAIRSADLRGKV